MTDCAMYNVTMEGSHPSTICIEISKLPNSLKSLTDMIGSEYMDEMMSEFIKEFARTDEIMPEDRTLGFVVFNGPKKQVSIAFSRISDSLKKELRESGKKIESTGFKVEYDFD